RPDWPDGPAPPPARSSPASSTGLARRPPTNRLEPMAGAPRDDRIYFRHLLSGRDFAAGDVIAAQMRNFAYLIGDRETGDAVVVDPAYAANDLVDALESDGMRLAGVLVTHHHPDHVGGTMMGFTLKGLAELMDRQRVPVHVNS